MAAEEDGPLEVGEDEVMEVTDDDVTLLDSSPPVGGSAPEPEPVAAPPVDPMGELRSALSFDEPAPAAPAPPAAAPAPVPPAPAAAPFAVTGVELGRAIDANKKVAAPTTEFAPGDTIYAVVASTGKSSAVTIKARWTYGDEAQLVTEQSESVAPTGPANTEFHIARPSGWPAGTYKVEITVDGAAVGTKTFTVK